MHAIGQTKIATDETIMHLVTRKAPDLFRRSGAVSHMAVSNHSATHKVVVADVCRGDLLVYFADGTAAMFRPQFLYAVRDQDGNRTLSTLPVDSDSEANT